MVTLVADKLEKQWLWEVNFCFLKAGRYKTWTLNSGLDYGLDYRLDSGLDLVFWNFLGLPTVQFLIACTKD